MFRLYEVKNEYDGRGQYAAEWFEKMTDCLGAIKKQRTRGPRVVPADEARRPATAHSATDLISGRCVMRTTVGLLAALDRLAAPRDAACSEFVVRKRM